MAVVFDQSAVFAAIPPQRAVAATREAFLRHHAGEWVMPPKTYVDAPGAGDFRAMPARGNGFAVLKWVTSFPANPRRGLPVVAGAALLSSAETGELLAIADCAAVTALRTGAAAAVSAQALARPGAERAAVIGCGVNGAWAARCLAAAGYGEGICADLDRERAERLAAEVGWRAGSREQALGCDVVVTVTPGERPVVGAGEPAAGAHLVALGADAAGKAEIEAAVVAAAQLFCDEWKQASGGGELSGPVARGEIAREDVTELGEVLSGEHPGRRAGDAVTLFDSTGLAIQDLGILVELWRLHLEGAAPGTEVPL